MTPFFPLYSPMNFGYRHRYSQTAKDRVTGPNWVAASAEASYRGFTSPETTAFPAEVLAIRRGRAVYAKDPLISNREPKPKQSWEPLETI